MIFSKISLGKAIVQLKRIADALEVIATVQASQAGRMVSFGRKSRVQGEDELLHTTDEEMLVQQLRDIENFKATGKIIENE